MCLAIYKPAGKSVPEAHLEEGFQSNRDGAGFAYVENGIVRYMKGFFDYQTFLENYNERVKDDYPAVIHFRWATVGEKNTENCHPFEAGNGGVLVHNGPQIQKLGDNDRSDSRVFAEKIIQPLTPEVIETTREVLEGYLGYNKVVLLYPEQVIILNEGAGIWDDGIWYSNDGYRSWYSYGNWQHQRSSMTQRHPAVFDAFEELGETAAQAMEWGDTDFLTEAQVAAMVAEAPSYMKPYIEEHIDLDTYFFDTEAKQWFFYDTSYDEYVHLVTGYAIDEYYEEILKLDYPYELEDGEEPVEAATASADADELGAILDTLGRAFEPNGEPESDAPSRVLN